MSDRLKKLSEAGVSIWLDDLSRERIETGNLADLVKNSSVVGITSNPTIFAAAISDGERYDDQVRRLAADGKAVLIASSYLPELLGTCDRIAVMHRGTLGAARPTADWTQASLLAAAIGREAA